jgi:ATP-dependent RNA helicase DeaD
VALSGELSQSERTHALQALRDGRARVCVATDVAARGLDLPDLGLVVHAELPINRATLLHRSGRTGRAGRKGVSVLLAPLSRQRRAEQLIHAAGVEAQWSGPPSAAAIRERDADRLLEQLADDGQEPAAEDTALAARLLDGRSPEQIAAALVRLYRAQLPEPEEVYDAPAKGGGYGADGRKGARRRDGDAAPREERPRRERPERAPEGVEGAAWFRLNIGRDKNADPKWLIPLICRLGHVTKPDIGAIRIFDRETKFEILPQAAERFAAASEGAAEGGLRITPAAQPPGPRSADRPRPKGGPRRGPPPGAKKRPAKTYGRRQG